MIRLASGVVAALLCAGLAGPASAQSVLPISVEGRGGLGFPTGDFGRNLGTGYGLGANAQFNLSPMLGIYGGYTYMSFDYDESVVGDAGGSFNVQGFDAGAKLGLPLAGLSPYLRAGVVYYKGEDSESDIGSDRQLGFQGGVGLDYVLGPVVTLTPEVSYVMVPGKNNSTDATFIKLDFGLRFRI